MDGRCTVMWSSQKGQAVPTTRKSGGNFEPPTARAGFYDTAYGKFASKLYAEIRAEAFGEDIGQQSWLSAEEHDRLIAWLDLDRSICCSMLPVAPEDRRYGSRNAQAAGCTASTSKPPP